MSTRKVLFLDYGIARDFNPYAYLIKIPNYINTKILNTLELSQPGALRMGTSWQKIMEDGEIEHTKISEGRKSDYTPEDYDEVYKLITGNY